MYYLLDAFLLLHISVNFIIIVRGYDGERYNGVFIDFMFNIGIWEVVKYRMLFLEVNSYINIISFINSFESFLFIEVGYCF
jgi:hypothetical protein